MKFRILRIVPAKQKIAELRNRTTKSGRRSFNFVASLFACLLISVVFDFSTKKLSGNSGPALDYLASGKGSLFAFAAVLPSLFFAFVLKPTLSSKLGQSLHGVFGFIAIYVSYYAQDAVRQDIAKFFRFNAINPHLADWIFIPAYIACPDDSGCDPLGRSPAYGVGWKLLFLLSNLNFSIFLLAVTTGFVCAQIYKYAAVHGHALLGSAIIVSPSFLFAVERGNSDLFVVGLILVALSLSMKSKVFNLAFSIFMVTLKPFFAGIYMSRRHKLKGILLILPIFATALLASYKFDFLRIQESRKATLFSPYSVFGVDQIPALFIQQDTVASVRWSPSYDLFRLSFLSGVISFIFLLAILVYCQYPGITIRSLGQNVEEKADRLTVVFSAVYLLTYLSGSQVWYKTWFAFPILFLIIKKYNQSPEDGSLWKAIPDMLMILSIFGISIWSLRSLGTLFLALYCAQIVIQDLSLANIGHSTQVKLEN